MKPSEKLRLFNEEILCGIFYVYENACFNTYALKLNHTKEEAEEFFNRMDEIENEDLDNNATVWFDGGFAQFTYDYESCAIDAYIWEHTYTLSFPEECL